MTPADQPETIPFDVEVDARGVIVAAAHARETVQQSDESGTADKFHIYYAERIGPGPNSYG